MGVGCLETQKRARLVPQSEIMVEQTVLIIDGLKVVVRSLRLANPCGRRELLRGAAELDWGLQEGGLGCCGSQVGCLLRTTFIQLSHFKTSCLIE